MDNNTVLLSVVGDLIHWPLPPSSLAADTTPFDFGDAAAEAVDVDALWCDDALLSAGNKEDLHEEPRERQRSRCDAVRRLSALAQALGPQWARKEIIPYMLRCIGEDDAELSFAIGMALIDFATPSPAHRQQTSTFVSPRDTSTENSVVNSDRLFTLQDLLPVVVRMAASSDIGVRRFLVEVVIPMCFFGVSLEHCIDLRDWKEKYLNVRPNSGDDEGAGEELGVTFGAGNNFGRVGREARHAGGHGSAHRTSRSDGQQQGTSSRGLWDPFEINIHAGRLRSAVAAYLCDLGADCDGTEGVTSASFGKTVEPREYTDHPIRREAFTTRWGLFLTLMRTMLKSEYVATMSTAVECISNIFSCIKWFECMESRCEAPSSLLLSSMLQSIEELVAFVFITTRTHVGRAIHTGAKTPCEDLMTILFDNSLLLTTDTATSLAVGELCGPIRLGRGGFSTAEHDVWDLCLRESTFELHRLLRVSLLRSLPRLIDWTRSAAPEEAPTTSTWRGGLSFSSVCNILAQVLATPSCSSRSFSTKDDNDSGDNDDDKKKNKWKTKVEDGRKREGEGKLEESALSGNLLPLPDGDACRDFGIAEAVFDGVQQMFDELLHPNTIEDFLQRTEEGRASPPTVEKKQTGLMQLCALYRDCVIGLAGLPSWRTRWLATQRIPKLTATLVSLLRRVGNCDANNGPALVETCMEFLCQFHTEQWSSSPSSSTLGGVGGLREFVFDEEEEVRSVVAACAAGVFRELGQGLFSFVFPDGVVGDMHRSRRAGCTKSGVTSPNNPSGDGSRNMFWGKKATDGKSNKSNNDNNTHGALLSVESLFRLLTSLFEVILSCCASLLEDSEERVRSGVATGLSALVCTLAAMVTMCDLHLEDLGKETWLRHLDNTTTLLMKLLTDQSPTVQLALVSELAALLANSVTGAGRVAATMGTHGADGATPAQKEALLACLKGLSLHAVWRYRERFARLLSEMCVKFLLLYPLRDSETRLLLPLGGAYSPERAQRESGVGRGRSGGRVVVAKDAVDPLQRFAVEELLPLLVDALFDKVKAVRDGALEAVEGMCARLSAAQPHPQRLLTQNDAGGTRHSHNNRQNKLHNRQRHDYQQHGGDAFINKTLWPLIIGSPKAMATYLSRSSLLRIAVRLGVDKDSILLPLLDHLAHDEVLNVRLVVAKELFGVLAASSNTASSRTSGTPRVTFTEEERNGVVLRLLRLLVQDKSGDVRDEAAKALKLCF